MPKDQAAELTSVLVAFMLLFLMYASIHVLQFLVNAVYILPLLMIIISTVDAPNDAMTKLSDIQSLKH